MQIVPGIEFIRVFSFKRRSVRGTGTYGAAGAAVSPALAASLPSTQGKIMTPQQMKCLTFIDGFISQHGHSPSFQEIAEAINITSKSGVKRLVDRLAEAGWIYAPRSRQRAIEVLRLPASPSQAEYFPDASVEDLARMIVMTCMDNLASYGSAIASDVTVAAFRKAGIVLSMAPADTTGSPDALRRIGG